ncbi:MAG: LD-carboxypeptidase [Bacteriovoracaceae bacterium]
MKNWPYLKPNDTVDIIAPASSCPTDKLQAGLEWLESVGLIPRVPKGIVNTDVFFSAPLEDQLDHLVKAIYSDSKAIWCLRGGYGSMRLIPYLQKLKPPKHPKLFIGFSDITALHLFFNQTWNWPTLHGKTVSGLNINKKTHDIRELKKIIFGELTHEKTFKKLRPLNESAYLEKEISGKIVGGNLRILQSSLGTSWEVNPRGKILFIEDVSERGYSIDRMLEQMHQAKIIRHGIKALLIGDFTEGQEKSGKDLTSIAIKRFAERVSYPVLSGLPCGHGPKYNYTLPFNTLCKLTTGKKPTLTCDFGGM